MLNYSVTLSLQNITRDIPVNLLHQVEWAGLIQDYCAVSVFWPWALSIAEDFNNCIVETRTIRDHEIPERSTESASNKELS